jgi:hypothetical protein
VSREEASAFVAMLLATARKAERRLRVMLTMRSDFVGDCEVFLGLPQAVSQSQFLVPRLTRSQMEAAITGPSRIRRAGFAPFEFQEGLVNTLINEAGDRPDLLPQLQHALMRTWKLSDRRLLTEGDYDRAGRFSKSLSNDADEAFQSLDNVSQQLARRLFLLLCDVSAEGQFTRRRPVAQEVLDVAQVTDCATLERVVRVFQDNDRNFLLPPRREPITPATVLDVSHESLLRQWEQLRKWRDAETKSAQQYRRLRDELDSNTKFLSDTHLAQAQEWVQTEHPNDPWARRYDSADSADSSRLQPCLDLIERSDAERKRKVQEEREAVEAETRRAREAEAAAERFQRRTAAAVAACVVAMICLGVAIKSLVDARRASVIAKKAEGTARKSEEKSLRQNEKYLWQFAVLARDDSNMPPVKASHLFLRSADALGRIPKPSLADRQAILRNGNAAAFLDRPLIRSWVHDGSIRGCQFSCDESRVLTWSDDKVWLWDMTKPEAILILSHNSLKGAKFSQDETRVLTWSDDKVWLWDVTDPLAVLSPAERVLELEVRSSTTLDEQLNLRTLSFAEWQAKAKSPAYREIEKKLAARPARRTPAPAPPSSTPHELLRNAQ